jgi:hypothetical protein
MLALLACSAFKGRDCIACPIELPKFTVFKVLYYVDSFILADSSRLNKSFRQHASGAEVIFGRRLAVALGRTLKSGVPSLQTIKKPPPPQRKNAVEAAADFA